eukprot:1346108-Amorphochlora_amoeboformis.AAC.2
MARTKQTARKVAHDDYTSKTKNAGDAGECIIHGKGLLVLPVGCIWCPLLFSKGFQGGEWEVEVKWGVASCGELD